MKNISREQMTRQLSADELAEAVEVLAQGGLVAFPTETVYGLGADAENSEAVKKIYAAKGRPIGHPLIVHIANADVAWSWASEVPDAARALAAAFWPGPLTMILPRSDRAAVETVGGRDSIGLRVPDHQVTLDLLARFDGGLAGPSANRFGHVSPTTAAHVLADLDGRIDAVIEGGPSRVGLESTIVEFSSGEATLLRPGGISAAEVQGVLDDFGLVLNDGRGGESRAAGMLASHYSPNARVVVVAELADITMQAGDVVISAGPLDGLEGHELPADAEGFAEGLYAALRTADLTCTGRILVVMPGSGRLLDAVRDRLAKAAFEEQS